MSDTVIVVGSGASAVHAAWPLVMAGREVVMIDAGARDTQYAPMIPDLPFQELRRRDPEQHRYLLGDAFEGVPFGKVRVGAQLTPPRAFINRDVERHTPIAAGDFAGMESLATGGLASGWGAGACRFTEAELADGPVRLAELAPHYAAVEERIGVCGEDDDLTPELGLLHAMMPPLAIDDQTRRIHARYLRDRERFHRAGLRLGVTRLAACSREHRGRGPHRYDDLDFWADKNRAVYRPRWTLDELRAYPNFRYLPGQLAVRFDERATGVRLRCREMESGAEVTHDARAVVLAAGVFGTARVVLRSLDAFGRAVPYVTNPYTYAPCLNLDVLGHPVGDVRHSLSQLTATFSPPGSGWPPMHVSIYSYRSLLTSKLMKEVPLSARLGLGVMRNLTPLFAVMGLHHADAPTPLKTVTLDAGTPERLRFTYGLTDDERARIERSERLLVRQLRHLRCVALKRVNPGPGSSIHYGGTFPMAERPGALETSRDGLLAGTRAVYLADGSLLRSLPAKGLTLTLMANADRIGTRLAQALA